MRNRTHVMALLVGAALMVGGCASAATSSPAGAGGPAASPSNTSGCPTTLTITPDDAAKTVCVAVGGTVTVDLSSADGSKWLPIDVSGASLQPAGTPSAAVGAQTATYTAKSTGSTDITSEHRACPSVAGAVSCNAIIAWKVTVQVK